MSNFYISDTHFDHTNILRFDKRPFTDTQEMAQCLISNWNSTVKNNDTVYILGDFCWGKADAWVKYLVQLKGNKVLIRGNHDLKEFPLNLKNLFADIKDYKEIKDGENTVLMSHYPLLFYKHSGDEHTYMLHGHVHHYTQEAQYCREIKSTLKENYKGYPDNRSQIINVGSMLDYMNYTPRSLEYLINKFNEGVTE